MSKPKKNDQPGAWSDAVALASKRSSMTLFSNPHDHYSHRARLVLAEKGVAVDVVDCDDKSLPEEILSVNPYSSLPTLLDRDLVLYESTVIMEYLDERFPHPPLLPVYPVARATSRLLMFRVREDWCSKVDLLLSGKGREAAVTKARREFVESLINLAPIFNEKPFFMSEEFTLVDCCVAPILWRLKLLGINLPERASRPLTRYMQRVFDRDAFRASLSEAELEMRE